MDAEGNCSLEVPDQSVQHILEQVLHYENDFCRCKKYPLFHFSPQIPVIFRNQCLTFDPTQEPMIEHFQTSVPTNFQFCESKFVSITVVEYIRDVISTASGALVVGGVRDICIDGV